VSQYGLSEVGQVQAKLAGEQLVRDFLELRARARAQGRFQQLDEPLGISVVASDFCRARETAQFLVQAVLDHNENLSEEQRERGEAISLFVQTPDSNTLSEFISCVPAVGITHDARLRERWFGNWDGQSDVHYHDVWKDDLTDPHHTNEGVESVWSVVNRATALVCEWEQRGRDLNGRLWVICVAHGDVLQILQTAFCKGMDPAKHRSLEHLETARMRRLVPSLPGNGR
jgi:broad specificity phosphatase PhoE